MLLVPQILAESDFYFLRNEKTTEKGCACVY